MGVNSLWNVLDSTKQSKSLLLLAEEHRRISRSAGIGERGSTFKVGVDMGTLMAECNAGARIPGVNYQQAGSGLYLFFKRLGEFLKVPAAFVFVLDGPARPPVKRGHEVQHQPIWWTHLAVDLIRHFGFQFHNAPGEAEAELARFNKEGHVHAVITSDSDAYLFGAQLVLRSIPKGDRKFPDEYSLYNSTETELSLTHEGIVFFALLCGGDYGDGIDGCGPTTAVALARCGFGDQLLAAYHHLRGVEFERFLIQWRCAIRVELQTNVRGFLSRRQPKLAASISDNFPDPRILDLYVNPVTSWSPGHIPPDPSQWQSRQPSIPEITRFCVWHFHWRDHQTIQQRFKANLWEGVFLQMLYSPSSVYDHQQRRFSLPNSIHADWLAKSYQRRSGQFALIFGDEPQPKLVISTADFVNSMGAYAGMNPSAERVTVWPPVSLLPEQLRPLPKKNSNTTQKRRGPRSNGETSHSSANLQEPNLHALPPTGGTIEDAVDPEEDRWVRLGESHWFIDLTK